MIEAGATREEVFASSVDETRADLLRGGGGLSPDPSTEHEAADSAAGADSVRSPRASARGGLRRGGPAAPSGPRRPQRRRAPRRIRGGAEPHHGQRHDRSGGGVAAEHRGQEAGATSPRRRPRTAPRRMPAGATSTRCATRSTACGRCSRSSSAGSPRRCGRCATRSPSCRWHMPPRSRRRPVPGRCRRPPPARVRGTRTRARRRVHPARILRSRPRRTPVPGPAQASGRLWVPGS